MNTQTYDFAWMEFEAEQREKGNSEVTIEWYKEVMRKAFDFFTEHGVTSMEGITKKTVKAYQLDLQTRDGRQTGKPLSPDYVASQMRGLKAFLRFHREEYPDINTWVDKLPKVKVPDKVKETYSEDEVRQMLTACSKDSWIQLRNRLLILILFDTGVRSKAVRTLKWHKVDLEHNRMRVRTKGDSERNVPLSDVVKGVFIKYLRKSQKRFGDLPEYVFLSTHNNPWNHPRRVYEVIKRTGEQAGLPEHKLNVHRFRHTFATNWIRDDGDIGGLKRMLGHSTYAMSEHYVQQVDDGMKKAHAKRSRATKLMKRSRK